MGALSAVHAYLADCSDAGSRCGLNLCQLLLFYHFNIYRSRVFSLSLGLIFAGFAIGPTLGGLLIRYTHHTLSVFYAAAMMHALYAFVVWFFIPESLTPEQMKESVAKRRERLQSENGVRVGMLKRMFGFLSPLSIFIPQKIRDYPLKRGRDWDLTLLVVAYGFTATIMVSPRLNTET